MPKHFSDERRKKIVQLVNDRGSCGIAELAEYFSVTTETIRKDIIYLEKQQEICKVFGGAVSVSHVSESPMGMRSAENIALKELIAKKANDYVKENQVILIDSGSTTLAFVRNMIAPGKNTIITNSIPAAITLAEKGAQPILIGGNFSQNTLATSGMVATQTLGIIKADIAFLGASGFQLSSGPSAKDFCDVQLKKDMISSSRKRIVLADSSKLTSDAFIRFADWAEIDMLITDSGVKPEIVEELQKYVQVVLA